MRRDDLALEQVVLLSEPLLQLSGRLCQTVLI